MEGCGCPLRVYRSPRVQFRFTFSLFPSSYAYRDNFEFISLSMSGFDLDRVFSVAVHEQAATNPDAPSETARLLNEFILQFRVGEEFVYR